MIEANCHCLRQMLFISKKPYINLREKGYNNHETDLKYIHVSWSNKWKKTVIIHNNQNRDKLNDDLQKFVQTSEHILRTLDVMMKMRSHY